VVVDGCSSPLADRVRITEIDVGIPVVQNEEEAALMPLALSPIPAGGSRLAFMGEGSRVYVAQLDASDQLVGTPLSFPAHDLQDLHADDAGGVVLITRDAEGGGVRNCGAETNLCGAPPEPVPCFDMVLMRFDGTSESWATKLTTSSAALPPYSTGPDGDRVYMIWWYAHHGRIAFDGTNYGAFYGAAISVSQNGCINIHQGDEMRVVGPGGSLLSGGFDWGCSHSGYERIIWDERSSEFVTICKTDNDDRIAFSPDYRTILPVDLAYSNLGSLVTASSGGYWLIVSDIRPGEPAGQAGLADVHLVHFVSGEADQDLILANDAGLNVRAPHLAAYGSSQMVAAWETSASAGDLSSWSEDRTLHVQVIDRSTGSRVGEAEAVEVAGNRYQDFRAFPDGSVAYPAPGSTSSRIKILRVLPCAD
jgi:hypothetical protein